MDEGNIDLTIKSGKLVWLVEELRKANAELADVQARLASERAYFAAYKAAEAERVTNIRKQTLSEYERRVELLELNERKSKAYSEYLQSEGLALHEIKTILRSRITKKDEAKINTYLDSITKAWEKFDAVQKQIVDELAKASWDPCKSKMPPPSVREGAKE